MSNIVLPDSLNFVAINATYASIVLQNKRNPIHIQKYLFAFRGMEGNSEPTEVHFVTDKLVSKGMVIHHKVIACGLKRLNSEDWFRPSIPCDCKVLGEEVSFLSLDLQNLKFWLGSKRGTYHMSRPVQDFGLGWFDDLPQAAPAALYHFDVLGGMPIEVNFDFTEVELRN